MGILADLYVSGAEEAVEYNATPDQFADRAQFKSFTPLELSTLWVLIQGVEWDVAIMDQFPCMLVADEGERMIHRLPAAMVAELAHMPTDRTGSLTERWSTTEELSCTPEEIRPVVDELIRLSRLAIDSGRNVYLWNCV